MNSKILILMSCLVAVFLLVGCASSEAPAEVVVVEDDNDMGEDMDHDDDMGEAEEEEAETMDDDEDSDESGDSDSDMDESDDSVSTDNETEEIDADTEEAELEADVTIVMTGENFKFAVDGEDNPDITVSVGDVVTVEFSSAQGFHDFVVDELDAATAQVRETDGMTSVTFTATEAGSFEYYCSVGSHREQGMVGNFIVE